MATATRPRTRSRPRTRLRTRSPAPYGAVQAPSADNVQYMRGRGEVLHAFQAALAEELTVAAGETVRAAPKPESRRVVLSCGAGGGADRCRRAERRIPPCPRDQTVSSCGSGQIPVACPAPPRPCVNRAPALWG